ncbi:hypothetical protein vseg_002492 [Gypsophila vaccaria]
MKTKLHLCFHIFLTIIQSTSALGTGATLSVSFLQQTVCGIVVSGSNRSVHCVNENFDGLIEPTLPYDIISGGANFFCGLTTGGASLYCWDTVKFSAKQVYEDESLPLRDISAGYDNICMILKGLNHVYCARSKNEYEKIGPSNGGYLMVTCGVEFSCGIYVGDNNKLIAGLYAKDIVSGEVRCWGKNSVLAKDIQDQFNGIEMTSITAGGFHVCGSNLDGFLICRGLNYSGQLNYPFDLEESSNYWRVALGLDYSCAIKVSSKSVVCWGGEGKYSSNLTENLEFESLIGGIDFVCGLLSGNFSVICWGPGWYENGSLVDRVLPMRNVLPGVCVKSECTQCGVVPNSKSLCLGEGKICKFCHVNSTLEPWIVPPSVLTLPQSPISPPPTAIKSKTSSRGILVFAIVGSGGVLAGVCFLCACVCFGRKMIHYLVQLPITNVGLRNSRRDSSTSSGPPRPLIVDQQRSSRLRRLSSGPSSIKYVNRAEEFTIQELALATDDFAVQNKIGSGSFGVVYKGKLDDGREVAIKRGETGQNTKKCHDKSSFYSELEFLSRVHHKNLVRLVGYCEERDERLLVYEYMKKGALYDHLHRQNQAQEGDLLINSYKMRIKIALDAARGIEYLHNYAVPPIIHRDIKSSNILLDTNWTARVSDFGLSLLESRPDCIPTETAGTVGYIDPEYYTMNVLTTKSDVYGFGVVLLELLTGKKATFKDDTNRGAPTSVVDYAVPAILAGEMMKILDQRVKLNTSNELEAVELVAYTALQCVTLEGKDRPTMRDIVGHLECAIDLYDDIHDSSLNTSVFIQSD